MAGSDYWVRGAVRRYLARNVFHAVLIDRQHAVDAREALEAMARALDGGDSLILFPEGTRGTGRELAPFRGGLYHLAQRRPDVEIVPVYLANLNRILPKGEVLPAPLLSRVTFGPPITLAAGEEKGAFLARARESVARLADA